MTISLGGIDVAKIQAMGTVGTVASSALLLAGAILLLAPPSWRENVIGLVVGVGGATMLLDGMYKSLFSCACAARQTRSPPSEPRTDVCLTPRAHVSRAFAQP